MVGSDNESRLPNKKWVFLYFFPLKYLQTLQFFESYLWLPVIKVAQAHSSEN